MAGKRKPCLTSKLFGLYQEFLRWNETVSFSQETSNDGKRTLSLILQVPVEDPFPPAAARKHKSPYQREKEKARFQAWKKKMAEKISPTSPTSTTSSPPPTPQYSRTVPWINHRPPSLSNIPQLDGNISVSTVGNTEEDTSEGEHSPEIEEDVMSPLPRQEDNKARSPDVSTDPILVEADLPDPALPAPAPPEPPPEPTLPTLPDSEAASLFTYKQCFQPRT